MERIEEVVKRISSAGAEGGLTEAQLCDIVLSDLGEINCYPGIKGAGCHEVALFVSLKGKMGLGIKQISFGTQMKNLVNHIRKCRGRTREIVFLTDNWDPFSFEHNREFLQDLRDNGIHIQFFLVLYQGQITRVNW